MALWLWESVATTEGGPTRLRFRAARRWALAADRLRHSCAAVGPEAVLAAFDAAVALLPLLAPRGSARSDSEDLHTLASGLVGEATAAAIAAGDLDRALEFSEAGRAVLWTQLLDTRSDLDRLRAEHPRLAADLDGVRAHLDAPITWTDHDADERGQTIDQRLARRALAGRWQALVEQVRAAPGFEDFLRPASASRIRRMLGDSTVVVVNVAPRRCDALLVSGAGIELVALPTLDEQTVQNRVEEYLDALDAYENTEIERAALEAAVRVTLEWTWDDIAEPVLARTPASRVWWCPTGPLALLPLHAAGRHDQPGASVLDRVVSSYAPTIRALEGARRSVAAPITDGRMLGVAMPSTPGESDLPGAERDLALLARTFGAQFTALSGPSATRQGVIDSLADHRWVHFSCHGYQDLVEPSRGGLALYDGTLTGPQIASRRQWNGDFAFLSACQTATGGIAHLDEAITLAAALGYSGWRHVIGTLWSVDDSAATRFAHELYSLLLTNRGFDPSG